MRQNFDSFLGWLLGSFFRWWWALITGTASFLAFVWTPPEGATIGRTGMLLLFFTAFSLVFLVVSVVMQGYQLFRERYKELEVVAIQKANESVAGLIFILRGHLRDATGMLVEIRRSSEDVEVLFAIVQVTRATSKGLYQAEPVWVSPGNLREFNARRFSLNVLIARPNMYYDDARKAFEGMISKEANNVLP